MNGCAEAPRKIMRTPRKVELAITGRCNLRCVYCYHFDSPADVRDDLPTAEWLQFFEELTSLGVLEVSIGGGEAFIRGDFREIIRGVVKNRMRFSLLTNGTLITDELAAFLAETGRCNSVQVSIDGPSSAVHDKNCGHGSFEKAIRGLDHLKRYGINRTVRLTITRNNVAHLEEAARVLLEEVGLPSFSTNSACPFGLTKKNTAKVTLTPDEYAQAMIAHHNIILKYGRRVNAQAGPLSSFKHWTDMEKLKNEKAPSKPGCGYLTSCGGVFSKMAVRADGIMTPCTQIPHIDLGRINQDNLLEVWQNHPELKRLRERRQKPLSGFEYCSGCDYLPYCRGGCPANAFELAGDENRPVPSSDSCFSRFQEEGGVLPVFEN